MVLQDIYQQPHLHSGVSSPEPVLPSSAEFECARCCGAWGCKTFICDHVCIVLHGWPNQGCVLQLSACVLAVMEHGDARHSSSAACVCVCVCLCACVPVASSLSRQMSTIFSDYRTGDLHPGLRWCGESLALSPLRARALFRTCCTLTVGVILAGSA